MIAATRVSRTVIREAVAALRADRLVVTRQGVGTLLRTRFAARSGSISMSSRRSVKCLMSWNSRPVWRSRQQVLPLNARRRDTVPRMADQLTPFKQPSTVGENGVQRDSLPLRSLRQPARSANGIRFLDSWPVHSPRRTISKNARPAAPDTSQLDTLQKVPPNSLGAIAGRDRWRRHAGDAASPAAAGRALEACRRKPDANGIMQKIFPHRALPAMYGTRLRKLLKGVYEHPRESISARRRSRQGRHFVAADLPDLVQSKKLSRALKRLFTSADFRLKAVEPFTDPISLRSTLCSRRRTAPV